MIYSEAVRYLLSLIGDIRTANFGLTRMTRLLTLLGDPQQTFKGIHIAGTNGKGSTAALIESGLWTAGQSVGLYTSPHLVRFNERIRVAATEISDEDFICALEDVRAANERIIAEFGSTEHPTFFESITATAFTAFRNAGVEWAVVEVGLGGRLDATNVLTGAVGVVTPIDFDHERFLGKDIVSIATEKAGILKSGMKLVVAPQRPEVMAVLEERAAQLDVSMVRVGVDWIAEGITDERGCYRFRASRAEVSQSNKKLPVNAPSMIDVSLSLPGQHQVTNALTAVAALDLVGVEGEEIKRGLSQASWPGRLERISGAPEILLDAAHNPSGALTLAHFLERHETNRRIHLIYGSVRDKAVDEVAGILFPRANRVILTCSQVARSARPQTLMALVDHHHSVISISPNLTEALKEARRGASPEDLIVIAGSIFLVGEASQVVQTESLTM